MGVALRHRAEAVVEVEHFVSVDVPDPRALAALEVDRPWVAHLVRGGDPAGKRRPRALVHRARLAGALVERLALALRQLADAGAVDACGSDSHGTTLPAGTASVAVCSGPRSSARHTATSRRGSRV